MLNLGASVCRILKLLCCCSCCCRLQEKAAIKVQKDASEAKYKHALVDGRQEQVGSYVNSLTQLAQDVLRLTLQSQKRLAVRYTKSWSTSLMLTSMRIHA
jgi:hypothetical protein